MGWLVFGVVVMALLIAGGTYQLVTGRYVGVGRFASTYQPTTRLVRVTGCAGVVGGVAGGLVMLGTITGHLAAR